MEAAKEAARVAPGAAVLGALSLLLTLYNVVVSRQKRLENADANEVLTEQVSELVLVPANTALSHWYFWNVCTTNWVDDSLLKCVVFTALFFRLSVKLEAGMGHKGFCIFLFMATTLTGVVSSFLMLLMFFLSSPDYFFESTLTGQAGLLTCVLVGNVRLDVEDLVLPDLPQGRVKTRAVILPSLCVYFILAHVLPSAWIKDSCLACVAFFTSYLLLRHLEFNIEDSGSFYAYRTVYADDPFVFDVFFPEFARPFVRAVSALFGKRLFCCFSRKKAAPRGGGGGGARGSGGIATYNSVSRAEQGALSGSPFSSSQDSSALETSNPVADRRRALALKALDQKLKQIATQPEVALDDTENA